MISDKALALLLGAEGFRAKPYWPGGVDSGVTFGYGTDLGGMTAQSFYREWTGYLGELALQSLAKCVGLRGDRAKAAAATFGVNVLNEATAKAQFLERSLPAFEAATRKAFPGCEKLPADAYGALVSLVYNRGPSLTGDRRREMAAIQDILSDGIQAGDLKAIAEQIRAMKRLWVDAGLPGLLKRRDAEADLVEQAT